MSESEPKTETEMMKEIGKGFNAMLKSHLSDLEQRLVNLERGLEAVLRRLEESGQPDDETGWYGRPE